MLRAFADVKTGVKPQQATSNSACNKHTLCGSCLTESACVQCADAGGACVSGDVSTGPADAKISKIRNKYRIRILLKVEKKIAIQSLISQIIEQRKCPSFINLKIDVDPLTFT